MVPAQVAGDLTRRPSRRAAGLAVAVGGRIEAVGWSFHLDGDPVEHYSVMVPEATLHDGHNRVEVFEVRPRGRPAPAGALLGAVYISAGCVHGPCSRPRWPPGDRLLR